MILYDHLGGFRNSEWIVKKGIDFLISVPLNVIQDFGAFGVSLFFILSGFLFTWNAHYDRITSKTIKSIMKIYFSSCAAFLFFWIFNIIFWEFIGDTYWKQYSAGQWIESLTLIGYFTGKGEVINGTTWFLIPFFFFKVISVIYVFLFKKFSWKGIWIIEIILIGFFGILDLTHLSITNRLIYVYMPLCGAILGEMYKENQLPFLQGILLLIINYFAMVICFYRFNTAYYSESLYLVSFVYSVLLLIFSISLEKYFKPNRYINFVCDISLSIYLLQMTFGSLFITILEQKEVPFTIAFIFTVLFVVVISWLHTELIERRKIDFLYKRNREEI